ncbi:MAG: hemolysin, partial [Betaproteobacteria bacterium]
MPTVEFRIDVSGIPHSFVILNNGAGFESGYGFAPAEGLSLWGPGTIHDDTKHEYDFTTGPITISTDQYNAIAAQITNDINTPPYYDLPGSLVFTKEDLQCAKWVTNLAQTGGVDLPFNMSRGGWNPYGQAIWLELSKISSLVNTAYLASRATPLFLRDPLTLDLDGDGLETVGIDSTNPILFDHTGSGIKTATGWIKSDDAFLVLDRNGNGSIDNGQELFGDSTPLTSG